MNSPHTDNHKRWEDRSVVDYYVNSSGLWGNELRLFEKYIQPGATVLDIGVGGGRTTAWLANRARTYLGIDYSSGMIDACKIRFPALEFRVADATSLDSIESASFEVAIFSFNGIDNIHPQAARRRCLEEVSRVVVPNGVFIFSEHNARQILVWPRLHGTDPGRMVWRTLRSIYGSAKLLLRRLCNGALRHGCGYERDPVHGGLVHYLTTPNHLRSELAAVNMDLIEIAGPDWPQKTSKIATPWYYYVCKKL